MENRGSHLHYLLLAALLAACSTDVVDRRLGAALNAGDSDQTTTETGPGKGTEKDGDKNPDSEEADMPQWVNGVPLTCWYDTVTDDANVVIGCDAGSEPAALGLALTAAAQPTSYEWSLRDQATHDIVSAIATTETAIGSFEQPASALVGTEISVTASDGSTSVTVSGRTDALPGGALLITCMQAATDRVELEMCFSSQGVSLPSDKVELVKAPAPAAEASASPAPEASSSPDASSSPEVSPTPEVSPSPSASAMPSATATNTDDPSAPPT